MWLPTCKKPKKTAFTLSASPAGLVCLGELRLHLGLHFSWLMTCWISPRVSRWWENRRLLTSNLASPRLPCCSPHAGSPSSTPWSWDDSLRKGTWKPLGISLLRFVGPCLVSTGQYQLELLHLLGNQFYIIGHSISCILGYGTTQF